MTLASKTSAENVCDTLVQVIRAELPGKVSTFNAANDACPYVRSHFSGDYVLTEDKTLIIGRNNQSSLDSYTISSATYTVASIVSYLNGLSGFSDNFEAVAIMGSNYFEIRDKTKGTLGSIKIGEGTSNSIFGFTDNAVHNFYPLRRITEYRIQTRALDTTLLAYPALTLYAETRPRSDNAYQMIPYSVFMRLYETTVQPQLTPDKEAMYTQLNRLWDQIRQILFGREYCGVWKKQINSIKALSIRPGEQVLPIDQGRMHWQLWLNIELEITVQEDWQQ